jgi:hypothetical protein
MNHVEGFKDTSKRDPIVVTLIARFTKAVHLELREDKFDVHECAGIK